MPRGDMAGTVLFTDRTNRLCCEIQFGEIKVRALSMLALPLTDGKRYLHECAWGKQLQQECCELSMLLC